MPTLFQPIGADIVKVIPVTPGAIAGIGMITAALIDADVLAFGKSSIPYIQFERAKSLLESGGKDYTSLSNADWGQAKRAMCLACVTEYAKIDRTKRLMTTEKCESDVQFKEKIQFLYQLVCQAWKGLLITDSFYCDMNYDSVPSTILEGQVKETPGDLINTY